MGITALHLAARVCADDLVRELLRAGASPSARTLHDRRTPIDEAMSQGCAEAVVLLLAAVPAAAEQRAALQAVMAYAAMPAAALSLPALRAAMRLSESLQSVHRLIPDRERSRSSPVLQPPPSEAAASCAEGGGWDVSPPPTEAERRSDCDLDQLSGLSAESFDALYYRLSRPVLIRGATSLRDRCKLARKGDTMLKAATTVSRCGRTAYPQLTGQKTCGLFSLSTLNEGRRCEDKERTLPVCAAKPKGGVNASAIFQDLPVRFRLDDSSPPTPIIARAFSHQGSRQLFSGGKWEIAQGQG